jgi:hypothetical protein
MATLTHSYKPHTLRFAIVQKRDDLIEKMMPRRCMVVSVGMIFAGLGIPALMVFKLLPISLVLAFVGLALAAVGGVLALVFCGEL